MRLNHNMYSLGIYKTYAKNVKAHSESIGKAGSGLKIRKASDNPNKIAQSETLRMTVIGRNAASSNIQDTSSMLQTFDGALQEMNNNVSRLKQLTVKAATETVNDEDRAIIQKEVNGILSSINDLAKNTEFNSIKLSDPNEKTIESTIGTLNGETIEVPMFDFSLAALGLDDLNVKDVSKAEEGLAKVDNAINTITSRRSRYGAIQSRLDDTYTSMAEISDVLTEAQSILADADMAEEAMEITKNKILIDSGIGLMAQSNRIPMEALNILANVR